VLSSSGELRDAVELTLSDTCPRPLAVITGTPSSTLAQAATACAVVPNPSQRAVTHTHAFCGAVLAVLDIWGQVSGDVSIQRIVREASAACARSIVSVNGWIGAPTALNDIRTSVVYGTGAAWAGALEGALLVKEIAGIPAEGWKRVKQLHHR
jgi:fructoselysine-6-P-deglycase FrlB-like protein